jgi:hypothetical protein
MPAAVTGVLSAAGVECVTLGDGQARPHWLPTAHQQSTLMGAALQLVLDGWLLRCRRVRVRLRLA